MAIYKRFVDWLNADDPQTQAVNVEQEMTVAKENVENQVVEEMKRASLAKAPRTGKVTRILDKISSRVSNRIGMDQF